MYSACFKRKTYLKFTKLELGGTFLHNPIPGRCSFLIFFLLFQCAPNPTVNPTEIFDQYYRPYPNEVMKASPGFASQSLREEVYKLYEQGRYQPSIPLFDELLKDTADYDLIFYKANTFLALGNTQNALGEYKRLPKGSRFYAQAQWYIAMTHLREGNTAQAMDIFRKIRKDPELSYMKKEAAEIIRLK